MFKKFFIPMFLVFYLRLCDSIAASIKDMNKGWGFSTVLLYSG